ncbi:hypothetical protein Ahy_B01g052544 [Arachis hypogaea]|uniref:Uncharacterized protein n=1 Tax=Arachis hypogaea TaxID=3818 RepID=A0A445APR7_ARAHY|nr:hypothetical protein Ahy_B01g052544 [Arachis hypogaea]
MVANLMWKAITWRSRYLSLLLLRKRILKRPSKLSPRRRSSLPGTSPTVNPLQGASSATATKFANVMKFILTPGFKPPRKKN